MVKCMVMIKIIPVACQSAHKTVLVHNMSASLPNTGQDLSEVELLDQEILKKNRKTHPSSDAFEHLNK